MHMLKIIIRAFFFVCIFNSSALGEDTYNFHFEKNTDQHIGKQKISKEVDDDFQDFDEFNKFPLKPYRGWEAKLGFARATFDNIFGMNAGRAEQNYLSLGSNYNFSKYFLLAGEVLIASGSPKYDKYVEYDGEGDTPLASIALGVTPVQFSAFGRQFLKIGFDIGSIFSDVAIYNGVRNAAFLGPRLGMSFSRKLDLNYVYRTNINSPVDMNMHSLNLAYNWR